MKNPTREEKGAALAMTLITMAVLMIFGTVFLNVSSAENKFSERSEDKAQAYYIARAGAQSVAESLIKGDNAEFIIGKTSESYSFGGGEFTVDVSEPVVHDNTMEIDIASVGTFNDVHQKVTIRVEGSAQGAGMFSNAFYAFGDIDGGLNGAEIAGDIEAGGTIDLNNVPDNVKITFPVIYPEIPITVPVFTSEDTINITSPIIINAPTYKKVTGISLKNNEVLEINGSGVVSLFLYGNTEIKGDIIISSNSQLHIYVMGNNTFTFQGSADSKGKIFIYAPNGNVNFASVTNSDLKGLIISGNLDLSNHMKFEYDASVYDEVVKENWIDTTNIGVGYTGYTWISND